MKKLIQSQHALAPDFVEAVALAPHAVEVCHLLLVLHNVIPPPPHRSHVRDQAALSRVLGSIHLQQQLP
eukprot:1031508-Rhodomonas_salina.1